MKEALESVARDFKHEFDSFNFDRASWLEGQTTFFSQFSVEINPEPKDEILMAMGRLIWCNSLFEEKLSRAVFWLSCLDAGQFLELPSQGTKLSSRLGQLNKLLQKEIIVKVVGSHTVEWTRTIVKELNDSFTFRDDVVHGHHEGGWYANHVFRATGKVFNIQNSRTVLVDQTTCNEHANNFLEAAALLALYDHFFFELEERGEFL